MLRMFRSMRSRAAFTVMELIAVTAIVTSVSTASYVKVKDKTKELKCSHNLSQIGSMLQMNEITSGKLPKAAFFPEDPVNGKDSIRVLMKDCPAELFICPSAPKELEEKGLTFLWNDKCSGKGSHQIKDPSETWLMIEINVITEDAPAPHSGKYNVLYADLKTVKSQEEMPEDLKEEIEKKRKEAEEQKKEEGK